MSGTARARALAAVVAIAPAVLLLTLASHPYLPGRLPNDAAVAAAVADGPARWGVVHLVTAVASGLVILAFLALRSYLRDAGEDRFSAVGVPFIVMGGTLFTLLPGMEFAPLAAAETGAGTADVAAVQAALAPWFVPMMVTGALTFGVGVVAFVRGIAASGVLSPRLTFLVGGALLVMAVSRVLPFAAVQFYLQGAAGIVALWPLAYRMWIRPGAQLAPGHRPVPAT